MPRHERQLHAGEFFGDRARLLGIAGIVALDELQLPAEHAARGIDVGDRLFGAVLELESEGRLAARHGAGDTDAELLLRRDRSAERHACRKRKACQPYPLHAVLLRCADR